MTPAHASPVARLDGVRRSYGDVVALDHFDFRIDPGEVVGLLGPNGAGKTTAVKLLLGLLRPDAGTATVFGVAPAQRSARLRVGAMLQIADVPENLRVREHIELFRAYYPQPLPLDDVLRLAGLEEVAERLSRDLSGGQRQRLMFALAICGDPELLFLDEPTVGLDVKARRGFWAAIRSFVDRGRSVLLTTHYLEEAEALADRIVVIHRGRSVAEGSPRDITERFALRRIRCRTTLGLEDLTALPGAADVHLDDAGRARLTSETPEDTLRVLLDRDTELADLEVVGVGLEEAFLELTADESLENAA